MAVVRPSFFINQLCKHQKLAFALSAFFLISTTNFEKAVSYFSTSNSAFSQAYVLRIWTSFSPVETSFTALSFCSFNNRFPFRLLLSKIENNARITCHKKGRVFLHRKKHDAFCGHIWTPQLLQAKFSLFDDFNRVQDCSHIFGL